MSYDPLYHKKDIVYKKYKIVKELGQGNFGKIYLVSNELDNKKYALKVSKKYDNLSFNREIEALNKIKKLKTSNQKSYVINIIEFFEEKLKAENVETEETEEHTFKHIVLDYTPNKTLDYYFSSLDKSISEKYAKVILLKIAKGVKEIHDAKLCHLDLKLDNILLDEDYNPIICDFGVCRTFSTNEPIQCGTRGYIPPEMFTKKAFNGYKCDIFSLGTIFFKIFTGKKVFEDQNAYFQNVIVDKNKDYKDKWYQYIVNNQLDIFLEKSGINAINKTIPDLFFKMVTNDVEKRPYIDDVINDPWFDEINKLTDQEKIKLDEEIKIKEFETRKKLIQGVLGKNNVYINLKNNYSKKCNFMAHSKSIEEKNKVFEKTFSLNGLEELEEDNLNMKYYFKINDFENNLNVHNFMNNLVCELKLIDYEKDNENMKIKIIPSKKKYQIDIIFKNKELKIIEELKELGFNDYNEYLEAFHMEDLIIGIKLYRESKGYLINVYKKVGNNNFNKYLEKIMEIIKNSF